MPLPSEEEDRPLQEEPRGGAGEAAGREVDEAGAAGSDESTLVGDLDEVERARPERAFNVGVVLGTLVAVSAMVFVVQNSRSTSFDWLWFEFSLPLWAALVGAVAVGVILLATALAVHRRRRRRIGRRREATARLRRFLTRQRGPDEARGRQQSPTGSGSPA